MLWNGAQGMGAAAEVASQEMANDSAWVSKLSKRLYDRITSKVRACPCARQTSVHVVAETWPGTV